MPRAREEWRAELGTRARRNLIVTVLGTACLTALFFVAYFSIQRFPVRSPSVMPLTRLDVLIPFQPIFLVFYASLWVYVGTGPGLQPNWIHIRSYTLWMCALCVSGLLLFLLWPTRVPPGLTSDSNLPLVSVLHRVDRTSNACPSMHVAVAIFTLIRVEELLRALRAPRALRLLNLVWFAGIAYSTLAIKQHVILDDLAGAVLGALFAWASLRWRVAAAGC